MKFINIIDVIVFFNLFARLYNTIYKWHCEWIFEKTQFR